MKIQENGKVGSGTDSPHAQARATFEEHTDGLASIGFSSVKTYTDGETATFTFGNAALLVIDIGTGHGALVFFNYTGQPVILADPNSSFSVTSGTSSKVNVYKSTANSNTMTLQNNLGTTRTIGIGALSNFGT